MREHLQKVSYSIFSRFIHFLVEWWLLSSLHSGQDWFTLFSGKALWVLMYIVYQNHRTLPRWGLWGHKVKLQRLLRPQCTQSPVLSCRHGRPLLRNVHCDSLAGVSYLGKRVYIRGATSSPAPSFLLPAWAPGSLAANRLWNHPHIPPPPQGPPDFLSPEPRDSAICLSFLGINDSTNKLLAPNSP